MFTATKKALVVDDDPEVRSLVSLFLEGHGWETREGEDGDEAVALAVQDCPDVIILDLMMPQKDGFEAFKELREDLRTRHIPVVMLTAVNDFDLGEVHDAESIGRRLSVTPPEAFIPKPFDIDAVLAAAADATGE